MSEAERYCPLCETHTSEPTHCGVPTVSASLFSESEGEVVTGTIIAERYRIERVLGRGGMGAVYLATQLAVNRPVALKTLLRQLISDEKNVKRFYLEAQAASQLNHPNIVRVFDFGIDPTTHVPYIVMEYLEGRTVLDAIRQDGPMPERRAASILAQVAKALVEAHGKEMVHRDLKPENIHLRQLPDDEEHAKVLDFGLAKVIGPGSGSQPSLTGSGAVGTPLFMSPEQILGEALDFRSDLYSLGCILHQMLTGAPPFTAPEEATSNMSVLVRHINEIAPGLPPQTADGQPMSQGMMVLHKALLAKSRDQRPASTLAVAKVLGAIARGQHVDVPKLLADAAAGRALPSSTQHSTPSPVSSSAVTRGSRVPAMGTEHSGLASPSQLIAEARRADERRRTPLIVALLAILVGGGVAAFLALGGGGGGETKTPEGAKTAQVDRQDEAKAAPKEATPDEGEAKTPPGDDSETSATKAPPEGEQAAAGEPDEAAGKPDDAAGKPDEAEPDDQPKEVAVAEPAKEPRRVEVRSTPSANVFLGDKNLGTTPVSVPVPEGDETVQLRLSIDGYKDREVPLTMYSSGPIVIELDKERRRRGGKSTRSKKKPEAKEHGDKPDKKGIPVW